jgi:hypothetical protein
LKGYAALFTFSTIYYYPPPSQHLSIVDVSWSFLSFLSEVKTKLKVIEGVWFNPAHPRLGVKEGKDAGGEPEG